MTIIGKIGVEVLRRVHLMDDKVDSKLVLVIAGVAIGVIGEAVSENKESEPSASDNKHIIKLLSNMQKYISDNEGIVDNPSAIPFYDEVNTAIAQLHNA